jgi:hypothetical protein
MLEYTFRSWKIYRIIRTNILAIRDCVSWYAFESKWLYLLTELSPSWGAANYAAPQELPSILWNPKVQYRVHNSRPLVPIPSHINQIHSIPSYLIHLDTVHPPTSWSSQWSLSFWLPHQYRSSSPWLVAIPTTLYQQLTYRRIKFILGFLKIGKIFKNLRSWCH